MLPKHVESCCRSNQLTSIELSLSYPLTFPPLTVKMKCLLQRWEIALLTRQEYPTTIFLKNSRKVFLTLTECLYVILC